MLDVVLALLDIAVSIGIDVLVAGEWRPLASRMRANLPITVAIFAAFSLGALSGVVVPTRLFKTSPLPGVSLIIAPFLMGLGMYAWGEVRGQQHVPQSTLATWYGGSIVGFCLACGRFAVLRLA